MITTFLDVTKLPFRTQEQKVFDNSVDYVFRNLPTWGAQVNQTLQETDALATTVVSNAAAASQSAQIASAAMQAAIASVGAPAWVSGTNYAKSVAVISQVNFQAYRRVVAGAGTTDPANDNGATWMPLFGNGSFTVGANSSATFDLAARNFFTRAMSASETWAFTNCPTNGFSFGIELAYTGGTLSLPTSVKSPNNIVYSFTAGKTYLLLFVTTNKGARWRMSVTEAYDN